MPDGAPRPTPPRAKRRARRHSGRLSESHIALIRGGARVACGPSCVARRDGEWCIVTPITIAPKVEVLCIIENVAEKE